MATTTKTNKNDPVQELFREIFRLHSIMSFSAYVVDMSYLQCVFSKLNLLTSTYYARDVSVELPSGD